MKTYMKFAVTALVAIVFGAFALDADWISSDVFSALVAAPTVSMAIVPFLTLTGQETLTQLTESRGKLLAEIESVTTIGATR